MANENEDELSTSVAFDEQNNKYKASNINESWFQAKLLGAPARAGVDAVPGIKLHDVSYDPVSAVKAYRRDDGTDVRAHFRLTGNRSGTRIGKGEPYDKTHENTIDALISALNAAKSNIVFTTTLYEKKDQHREIWRCPKGSNYEWVREPETRQWFQGSKYIQPDICGFDVSRRSAGPNNKSVVIEVIRTHEPELETLDRLIELSKVYHLVIFYFCHPFGETRSWCGKLKKADPLTNEPLRLSTELYLLDGEYYKHGSRFRSKKTDSERRADMIGELKRIKKL